MLTIGEVASQSGLRTSAIRYYEARGLLAATARQGGRRLYDESILDTLAIIQVAKFAGFDLEEIRTLLSRVRNGHPARIWKDAAAAKEEEVDSRMRRLAMMKDVLVRLRGCTCTTFPECGRAVQAALSGQPDDSPMEK